MKGVVCVRSDPGHLSVLSAAPRASRSFFVGMRWFMLLVGPILAGLSPVQVPLETALVLGGFALLTVVLQVRLRHPYTKLDHGLWYIAFFTDLLLITALVVARGGLRSDVYILYFLVMAEAGLVLGMWQALLTGIMGTTLYTGSVVLLLGETDVKRIAIRCLYLMMIGIVTSFLAHSEKKAIVDALTDFKTHLPNFRHFQAALAVAVFHHQSRTQPLALAIVDVDNFKQWNARIGHPQADRVLEELASLLLELRRPEALIARYGGEEFILLMPNTSLDQASDELERIRARVAEHTFLEGSGLPPVRITISVGVASLQQGATESQLLVEADQALQAAKLAGKNQVRRFPAA